MIKTKPNSLKVVGEPNKHNLSKNLKVILTYQNSDVILVSLLYLLWSHGTVG